MADQHRWFKLWASAPSDDSIQKLPPATRWAWVAFGVYTKVHGDRGKVTVSDHNAALAAEMGVTVEVLIETIKLFPHMHVEVPKNRNGEVTVTWNNWVKYQVDSTVAQRQQKSRSKRRGEENKNYPPKPPRQNRSVFAGAALPASGAVSADHRGQQQRPGYKQFPEILAECRQQFPDESEAELEGRALQRFNAQLQRP